MYEVGDYIVYGNTGVCQVESVGPMSMQGMDSKRIYYILAPVYSKGSKIFTPVDNDKVIMRPVLTKEETEVLLEEITDIVPLNIKEEKQREYAYRDSIHTCEPREMVRIIKTIYQRKEDRLATGKKLVASDERFLHMAEENLYGELSIPLGIDKSEVEAYITDYCTTRETAAITE